MTNYEKMISMTKEELAEEIKLIANWDRKELNKVKNDENFFLNYLKKEIKG